MSSKILLLLAVVPVIVGFIFVNYLDSDPLESKILPTYTTIGMGGNNAEIILTKTSAIVEQNRELEKRVERIEEEKVTQASEFAEQYSLLQARVAEIEKLNNQYSSLLEETIGEKENLEAQLETQTAPPTDEQLEKVTQLQSQINELETKLSQLESNQTQTQDLIDEFTGFEQSIPKRRQPQIPTIKLTEEEITWTFIDSRGNKYSFSRPSDDFFDDVIRLPPPQDTITITTNTGTHEVRDLTKFVVGSMPEGMNELYQNTESDAEFIFEVWYIVSQFHVNSFEMKTDPKKPLDTFTKGEGDNEDLAILLADMIRSTEAGKNWEIKFVYFDSNNLSNPSEINHVSVLVNNEETTWLIEPTAKTVEEAFKSRDRIRGNIYTVE